MFNNFYAYFCRTPPYSLTSETRYEKMMELFDRKGHFCTTVQDIQRALKLSLAVRSLNQDLSLNIEVNT